jgi:hypothetical protein
MPNGEFQFLLSYINHGLKKLTSIPLVSKCTPSIAIVLFTIFTEQGPLNILQTDNGGEFSSSATNHVRCQMLLDDEVTDHEDSLYFYVNVNIFLVFISSLILFFQK